MNLLVVKPSSLGDVIHTLPAVHCLRQTLRPKQLWWIINSEWSSLLEDNPDVSGVITFPRQRLRGPLALPRFLSWCRQLSDLRPDLALDFQGLLRSAFIARRAKPGKTLGLSDAREGARFFYDQIAATARSQHAVERYLALARLGGAKVQGELRFPLPEGHPIADLNLPARFVVLHPFSRGPGKSLLPAETYRIAEGLAPIPVYLVGRSSDAFALPPNARSLVNQTTLQQLLWLLRRATFVISVDSGPMHLAAAVTKSLLGIHFWSDPRRVGPYRPDAWIWEQNSIYRLDQLPSTPTPAAGFRPDPTQIARFVAQQC